MSAVARKVAHRSNSACNHCSVTSHPALLFPRDVINPKLVDEHFRPEATAARDLGHDVALIDHDALVKGDLGEALRGLRDEGAPLIYRGWMVQPNRYSELESALKARNRVLRTGAASFELAHHLPRWYSALSDFTPLSVWTQSDSFDEFESLLGELPDGAAVLKDYSKSEKHYWHEAMFIPDVRAKEHARKVAERFRELRGDYFDRGFVIRAFEDFQTSEARSWWVNGKPVAVTAHPDAPNDLCDVSDLSPLEPQVAQLELAFISIDVTFNTRGELRVVEVGDGQVSDRPSTSDPTDFIRAVCR